MSAMGGMQHDMKAHSVEDAIAEARASDDQRVWLRVIAERLSLVRYVFLVQIEDGIPSAAQRSALEYADAVLIGWPDAKATDVVTLDDAQIDDTAGHVRAAEEYVARFVEAERRGDIDAMTDLLIRVSEQVAEIRKLFQPGFPLPTFAEIRRVVQDEWDEDMDKIDPAASGSASEVERQATEDDRAAGERA